MLIYGALVPHPPIILEEIGGEERKKALKTVNAMKAIREKINSYAPESILIFSPHGPVFRDGLGIRSGERLKGNLANFGFTHTWEWETDQDLIQEIIKETSKDGLLCVELTDEVRSQYRIANTLDHGVLVPLSFFDQMSFRLVATGFSWLPWAEQYALGVAIGRAVRNSPRRIVVIASGDLSHCLIPGAPVTYDPRGEEFDRRLVNLIQENKIEEILRFDPVLVKKAAECGFRSLLMLLGVFDGLEIKTELFNYEAPFGVGYAIAGFEPGAEQPDRNLLPILTNRRKEEVINRRSKESSLVKLARLTVENHLCGEEKRIDLELPPEANSQAGAFVSIKKHGELRGCIGTIFPTQPNVAEEIRNNAIAAAFQDPRFEPVQEDELDELVYSVDLLKASEPIQSFEELDPQKYGVIVRKGRRTGLLLPNLEGVESVEEQVAIAKRKAGIGKEEAVEIERFEVVRYF
jgi:AmmeMemoRadiSam system protein A